MTNKTEVEVRAEDRTAKLIMGMLVDCGVAFSYRRVPGNACAAVVSVASRNGATLLKIHDVVRDRLKRASATAAASAIAAMGEQPKPSDKLPRDYTLWTDSQIGAWFTVDRVDAETTRTVRIFTSLRYTDKQAAIRAAIAHHEQTGGA